MALNLFKSNKKSIEDIKKSNRYSFWASCLVEHNNKIMLVLPFRDLNKNHKDEEFLLEAARIEYSIPRRVSAIFFLHQFSHPDETLYDYFQGHLGDFNVAFDDYDDMLKSLSDLVSLARLVDNTIVV